ncbi:hypothetical protein Tco_1256116 [Tanacetum coccineum]
METTSYLTFCTLRRLEIDLWWLLRWLVVLVCSDSLLRLVVVSYCGGCGCKKAFNYNPVNMLSMDGCFGKWGTNQKDGSALGIGDATPFSIPFCTALCSSDGKETTSIRKLCFVGIVATSMREEEIPDGAVTMITPNMASVFIHVSIRARYLSIVPFTSRHTTVVY